MSDHNSSGSNIDVPSSSVRASDHSDEDSDVMADWELVSKDGELQDTSSDDSSSISGSSIEVMSLEDDETDPDLVESSLHVTPLAAEARTPMFILRVPSTEKALKALTLESDESDESEQTEDLNVQSLQTEESLQVDKSKNTLFEANTNKKCSKPDTDTPQREVTDTFQKEVSNPQELEGFCHCDHDISVDGEVTQDVQNVMIPDFEKGNRDQSCDRPLDIAENKDNETKQALRRELSVSEVNESLQFSISLPEVISMSECDNKGEGHELLHGKGQGHYHVDHLDPEVSNTIENCPEHENENLINQILEEGVRKEDGEFSPEQNRRDGDQQIPELHVYNEDQAIDNDLDLIVINPHTLPHGVQRYYYDVEQDDPETESSNEMDVHDDRIESDQSELQTTDNSNLSNVDISDLMENIHVNRQYLHHPKPWIDVFLNAAVVLVISVAIGMGIGHNLGSVPSWKIGQQLKTLSCHRNVDDFIHHTILDQKLDRCERKLVTREETLNKRYTKINQDNQKLKDEANSLRNEVYDLRSEVIRLKYKKSQEIALQDAYRKRESLTSVLVKANQLEQENSDLRLEIGRLKYGYHSNQNLENFHREEDRNEHQEQTKERDIDYDQCSKVKSLQNELDIERERSEMWRKLYKDKVEEMEKNTSDEENSTQNVFGCMKLMLKNLSLPVNISVNISKNIEEQWQKLQNVSLNSFVEILKSFVMPDSKENGNNWNSGNKKSHTRWSDTVKDALNKTRESMSDVTQQIQDTWKQVKNLSHDFWKKHEPTVSEHLRKVQETVHQATQQLKDSFQKSKWFSKNRKGRKRKNNRDNQDHFKRRTEGRRCKNSFKASTKRRGFQEGKHKNRKQNKHHGTINHNKRLNRQYNKLHNKMKNLNFDQFEKLSCKKRKKTMNVFNKHFSQFDYNRNDETVGMWFSCQRSWWSNIVYGQSSSPLQECIPHLFSWQLIVNNCRHCHTKICKNKRASDHHDQKLYRNRKHGRHQRKYSKSHLEFTIYTDQDEYVDKIYKFKENEDRIKFDQLIKNIKDNEPDPLTNDDLPGLVFDEVFDETKKQNLTEFVDKMKEDSSECNPEIEVCSKDEKNWYLRQMEQRKYERLHQYTPDGKGDWTFKRAEERDFERTYPDDWYFRRLNEENKHEAPPPPKHFMMTNNEDCFEEDGHISCVEW